MVEEKVKKQGKFAVVLVRGTVDMTHQLKDTLKSLNLSRKNQCVVLENNPLNKGMILKVKDYVTWGEIDEETFKKLVEGRGEELLSREKDSKDRYAYKSLEFKGKKYKKYFRLNPPQKGFGRKGIKMAFKVGGGLGYRGEKINDLIMRML
ncbi:MAG: uL30 family ribosomal protein [Nanoarchaeota archaeon]|nr:uL30 family ribosomal protein [Nanoarchaeota archaeon]MBU1644470.1 uL30 family ribosomal protein [Nanoarchaeota archaeon]MBU1976474.1 uL30 family ribosomal protein [Nanoarchaeota archaeon]